LVQVKKHICLIVRNCGPITLQENYWTTENFDDKIITMEELKEALKKTKNGKSPGNDNLNPELYKPVRGSFRERPLVF